MKKLILNELTTEESKNVLEKYSFCITNRRDFEIETLKKDEMVIHSVASLWGSDSNIKIRLNRDELIAVITANGESITRRLGSIREEGLDNEEIYEILICLNKSQDHIKVFEECFFPCRDFYLTAFIKECDGEDEIKEKWGMLLENTIIKRADHYSDYDGIVCIDGEKIPYHVNCEGGVSLHWWYYEDYDNE